MTTDKISPTPPRIRPIDCRCGFCGAQPMNLCVTKSGKTTIDFHVARKGDAKRATWEARRDWEARMEFERKQSIKAATDPRLEVRVQALETQLRASLKSQQLMSESLQRLVIQVISLAEVVTDVTAGMDDLDARFKRLLVKQAVAAVLDEIDAQGMPTFDDQWEVDQARFGEDLVARVEPVVT